MPDAVGNINLVICGCGPVGTLAALAAAKRGLNVEVYEMRDGE